MIENDARVLESLKILLCGVPAKSDRGWLGYCTVVLLRLGSGWALFDTGHYSDRSQLLESLKAVGVAPQEVQHVICSHLHFDHVLNLPLFPNASIVISQAELDYADRVSAGAIEDPSIVDFWPVLLKERKILAVSDSLWLEEGIEVVTLPGHTPGCLAMFVNGPSPTAVCGDVIKNAWEAMRALPSTPAANSDASRKSMEYVLARSRVIVPGHDRPFIPSGKSVEYLRPFTWKIYGNFFPQPQDAVLFDLALAAGVCGVAESE